MSYPIYQHHLVLVTICPIHSFYLTIFTMNPCNVLITGANRGIGLELVRGFLALSSPPKNLMATCRSPEAADELQDLAKKNKNITILKLDCNDVSDEAVASFAAQVEGVVGSEGLNLLFNNAGLMNMDKPVNAASLIETFTVNAVAPLLLARALIPLLKTAAEKGTKDGQSLSKAGVVNMSTQLASIADNGMGGMYQYRGSKAALNMFNKNLSIEYGKDGILFVLMHPGWVKTDLGGSDALHTVEQSVEGMMQVLGKCTEKDQGKFLNYNGKEWPW